jgi:hypothetical protein
MINCYINSVGFRIFSGFSLSFKSSTRLFIDVQKTILYFNCFFFFCQKASYALSGRIIKIVI